MEHVQPTILIGAGGAGIRVLRFLSAMADPPIGDDHLRTALGLGIMDLYGIDTDPESNAVEEELSPNLCRLLYQNQILEPTPARLPTLPGSFLCEHETVRNAVRDFSARDWSDQQPTNKPDLDTAALWFPRPEGEGGGLSPGMATHDSQLRPLGRLALFRHADTIFAELRARVKAVHEISQAKRLNAYIVSSLCGATGSGMFWDLAFFLKIIDPQIQVTGVFITPDVFESYNHSGRLQANAYAALKEITWFKNWRKPLDVEYPIKDAPTFSRKQNDPPVLNQVLLYGAFPAGLEVQNRETATVDVTCLRIAQNLNVWMRKDLRRALMVGIDTDASVPANAPERAHVFSTSSTVLFHGAPPPDITRDLLTLLVKRDDTDPPPPNDTALDLDDALELLELKMPGQPPPPPGTSLSPHHLLTGRVSDTRPTMVNQLLHQLDRDIRELQGVHHHLSHDTVLSSFVPDQLKSALRTGERTFEIEGLQQAYQTWIEDAVNILLTGMSRGIDAVSSRRPHLSADARRVLTQLATQSPPVGQAALPLKLDMPEVYYRIAPEKRRIFPLNNRESIQQWVAVLEAIRQQVADLPCFDDAALQPLVAQLWSQHVSRFQSLLYRFLDADQRQAHQATKPSECFAFQTPLTEQADLNVTTDALRPAADQPLIDWVDSHAQPLTQRLNQAIPVVNVTQAQMAQTLQDLGGPLDHRNRRSATEAFIAWLNQVLRAHNQNAAEPLSLDQIRALVTEVVDYWRNAPTTARTYQLPDGAAREVLQRNKSKRFVNGLVDFRLSGPRLLLFPFSQSEPNDRADQTARQLGAIAQDVFGQPATIHRVRCQTPFLFFLDPFRSAREIHGIQDLFRSYEREARGGRILSHVHRAFVDLPEILNLFRDTTVLCGNPGCTYNIRGLGRANRFCPGCDRAVLNYCGNTDCHAVDIAEQVDRYRAANRAKGLDGRMPYDCPACGGELRNYWWHCPDHGQPNPIDKISCKSCLEEHQRDQRALAMITRRPDYRLLTCHGCRELESEAVNQVALPENLAYFYRKGVNGHESREFLVLLSSFNQRRGHGKLGAHLCPNGSFAHMLFPTCPTDRRHHLYRTATGRFACTIHPEIFFYTCHHCEYPVRVEDMQQGGCPRCMKALYHCPFCSPSTGFVYPPLDQQQPKRCPNCTNLLEIDVDPGLVSVTDGLKEPAYCPNIYGCEAGAGLWKTACEMSDESCRVCPEPAAKRNPRLDLVETVEHCPLCLLVLSPIPDGLRSQPYAVNDVLSRFKKLKTEDLDPSCRICSCDPMHILAWIERDNRSKKEATDALEWDPPEPKQEGEEVLPEIHFENALQLLRAFHENRDSARTYAQVTLLMHRLQREDSLNSSLASLLDLFPEGSLLQKTIQNRVQQLLQQHERRIARDQHWHQSSSTNT